MKNAFYLLLAICLCTACINSNPESQTHSNQEIVNAKQLRHLVLFKFNETSTPMDINKLEDAFAALPSQIKEITDFEWGLNNSPEELNKGFTHCFFVTFSSEQDRSVYLPHPAHKAFVEMLGPHVADVLVLDYWTGK